MVCIHLYTQKHMPTPHPQGHLGEKYLSVSLCDWRSFENGGSMCYRGRGSNTLWLLPALSENCLQVIYDQLKRKHLPHSTLNLRCTCVS